MSSFSWSYLESDPSSGRHGNWTRLPNRSTSTLTTNFIASEGNLFYVPFQSLLIFLVTVRFCAILYHLDQIIWGLSLFVPFEKIGVCHFLCHFVSFDFGVVRHSCYYEYDINHHYS